MGIIDPERAGRGNAQSARVCLFALRQLVAGAHCERSILHNRMRRDARTGPPI
jgi:hypothetical protein